MAGYYDALDLTFAWTGDFLEDRGDFEDNSNDAIASLKDQLHDISASALGDWVIYPRRGSGLSDFVGEPNTKITGRAIHDRLRVSIVAAGLVEEQDLSISVIPVHINKLLIIIRVDAMPTPANSLSDGEQIVTALIFDYLEQGIYFLDKTPELVHK